MVKLKIRLFIEPDGEGFHAFCPELEGLHVGGDTVEEAIQNGQDAINAYIASLVKHNDPIPVGMFGDDKSAMESLFDTFHSMFKQGNVKTHIEEFCIPA